MFKVTGSRLLVRRFEAPNTTEAGVHIPDTAKEKGSQGVIVRVGDGPVTECCGLPMGSQFNPGDRVMFGKYAGTALMIDGEEHLVMDEEEIMGIFEEPEIDTSLRGV